MHLFEEEGKEEAADLLQDAPLKGRGGDVFSDVAKPVSPKVVLLRHRRIRHGTGYLVMHNGIGANRNRNARTLCLQAPVGFFEIEKISFVQKADGAKGGGGGKKGASRHVV